MRPDFTQEIQYEHLWSNAKDTVGPLLDCRPGERMECAHGLFLSADGPARVQIKVERAAISVKRTIILGAGRSCWLSCAGWRHVTVDILENEPSSGPTTTVFSAWLTEAPPEIVELIDLAVVPGAGTQVVPDGATAVIAAVGDPGATWVTTLSGITYPFPTALVAGVPSPVQGRSLTLTAANTLVWILEGM